MKRIAFVLLYSFLSLITFGQGKKLALNTKPLIPKLENAKTFNQIRGISPMTAFLLLDLKRSDSLMLSETELIDKYALIKKDDILYANAYVTLKDTNLKGKLHNYGVLINITIGNIITALLPVKNIEIISNLSNVSYIQIGEKVAPTMDNARTATNVNQVHTGTSLPQPYFGEGVVVGIIDGGFDYTHPNFYNSTGTSGYRVKRVWEQNATSGTPPAGYSYGRELTTETAILAAQRDVINQSHGTHVAGIAAGAGAGAATTYTGVASKADLVFVSNNMSDPGITDGIKYIQNYAASVGKPCVINMSLGEHTGPHDGTSTFDKLCDSFFVGEGRILVGAAGNEGNDPLHLNKTFSLTDTSLFTFIHFNEALNKTNGKTQIDVWGNVGDNFYAGVHIYNVSTNTFEDVTPLYNGAVNGIYSHTLYDNDFLIPDACLVKISTGINPNNMKPRALIQLDHTAQDDNYRYVIVEVRAKSTSLNMWADDIQSYPGKAWFVDRGYTLPVLGGNSTSTVGEIGGTGKNIISVGAYNTNSTPNGAIAPFSSKGPTADGRTKPDITAPGNRITSSVSRYDANYLSGGGLWGDVVTGVSVSSTSWWFAKMQGTSMAAPMTTGIIALWLEMYPDLTPKQVKSIFQSTAITDGFTGTIPAAGSNTWGKGKINAWNNLPYLIPPKPSITPSTLTICEGKSATLTAPSGYPSYKWNTGDTTRSINVNAAGSYRVKVTNSGGWNSRWSDSVTVLVNPTPPIPSISQIVDTLISSATTGNQWYRNGSIISGATGQRYTLTSGGNYKVTVTNSSGCQSESLTKNTYPTSIGTIENQTGVSIFPNPITQNLNIKFYEGFEQLTISIFDNSGKLVLRDLIKNISIGSNRIFDVGHLQNGVYSIQISNDDFNYSNKITILK